MLNPLDVIAVKNSAAPYFLGVDVGGTNVKIGIVDDRGSTLAFQSIDTKAESGPEAACLRIAETAQSLAASIDMKFDDIVRCGLGTPGPMCLRRGMLLTPTNLPTWHFFPARERLGDALGRPVSFINDANAAAYGEFWVGRGRHADGLALFTLGTGVGGGLIADGRLINGKNSFGSELGHVIVDSAPGARLCNWGGGQGQLEAYASASAVALRAQEMVGKGNATSLAKLAKPVDEITALDVHTAASAGDKVALEIVDEAAFYMGIGVTCAVHAIDPGLVVLGGAMNFGGSADEVGQRFLAGIRNEFQRRTFENVYEGTQIDFAILGGKAGYVGAAGIARQDYNE